MHVQPNDFLETLPKRVNGISLLRSVSNLSQEVFLELNRVYDLLYPIRQNSVSRI